MESRTIYLVLTRPIPRWMYVMGRFLGLLSAVTASMALMGLFHLGVLLLKGWEPTPFFFLSFPFMFLKIAAMTALALFFSLFSTSSVSSVVFSLFFWVLGHFGTELEFLASKARSAAAGAGLKAFMFILPRFDLMNYRDLFEAPGVDGGALLLKAAVYALLYTGACLSLSLTLFSRKEF
jgi:ABC-type transport system involved in multi-copper enzyme maturation permease subunit